VGRTYAEGIAETEIPLERQIAWHLQGNHYPPVHPTFIPVAIEAIEKVNDGEGNTVITMPNGIEKTAYGIVEGLHLETWCYPEEGWEWN
jgi:hypothetical protein